MADPYRGEQELMFKGRAYVVRPSFLVLGTIEQVTNQPLMTLTRRFINQEWGVTHLAAVIYAMLREQIDGLTMKTVGEELENTGFNDYIGPISSFLTHAMHGNKRMGEMLDASGIKRPGEAEPLAEKPAAKATGGRRKKN